MRWQVFPLVAVVGALAGQQARVDGEWNWKMDSPMGEVTARVELRTEGTKLTGTFHFSESRRLRIEDGTIVGDELKFKVKRNRNEGGTMLYEMMGRVAGNLIRGTARTPMGEPPVTAEWVMQRVIPAPRSGGPVSSAKWRL